MTTPKNDAGTTNDEREHDEPRAEHELSLTELAAVRGGASTIYVKPTKSKGGLDLE